MGQKQKPKKELQSQSSVKRHQRARNSSYLAAF